MQLDFLWKWNGSGGGGCPSLYSTTGDAVTDSALDQKYDGVRGYAVVGAKLGPESRGQVRDLAENEDVIFVPADVIERIGQHMEC